MNCSYMLGYGYGDHVDIELILHSLKGPQNSPLKLHVPIKGTLQSSSKYSKTDGAVNTVRFHYN